MSTAVAKRLLSPKEYLERERAADYKSEYFQGEMFAMAGASSNHTLIKDTFSHQLQLRLAGRPCFVWTSDLRVKVDATGLYTYPDLIILCGEPEFEDNVHDTLLNPQVLIEVLSDSTEKYDRGTKFDHYRELPSVQEYLLVAQDRPLIERYLRRPDDSWVFTVFKGLDQSLTVESVSVTIPLAEIYAKVKFPESPGR